MSASRDRNEKITFVYSNLYRLYQEAKDAATRAKPFESGQVIRKDDFTPGLKVDRYRPSELNKVPTIAGAHPASERAIKDLKSNLQSLTDLQGRLNFMLKEIEDLLKPKK